MHTALSNLLFSVHMGQDRSACTLAFFSALRSI